MYDMVKQLNENMRVKDEVCLRPHLQYELRSFLYIFPSIMLQNQGRHCDSLAG